MKVRDCQAPMRSHLARRRGSPMADRSNKGHGVTQSKSQAIGLRYHIHSQRSCRLLSFSGYVFDWPGHGSAAASLMGERVGEPMASAPGIGPVRAQPDRAPKFDR